MEFAYIPFIVSQSDTACPDAFAVFSTPSEGRVVCADRGAVISIYLEKQYL